MATTLTTNQDTPAPIFAGPHRGGSDNGASTTAAGASPRWSDADPRPGSGHRDSTSPLPEGRPTLIFPVGGHACRLYRAVCGFDECVHGHVRRIGICADSGSGR